MRPADRTFSTKTDADRWLTTKEAEILNGDRLDPDAGRVPFGQYAATWIEERPGLRSSTIRAYQSVLRRHLVPAFGARPVSDIREPHVRQWRKSLADSGVGAPTMIKAYVLLKAIMGTAVDDGLIRRNPCRIKGVSAALSPERPVVTMRQVLELAEAIDPRYRAMVLLAAFGSLRWGELAALRRADLDLVAGTVKVERSLIRRPGGGYGFGPPKSAAGRRTVIIPPVIIRELARSLDQFPSADDDPLFTSPEGSPLHHGNFRRRTWLPAVAAAGLADIHLHDLRHAGNTFTADAGANLRELMDRMGHSSTRAALIYLHGGDQRQQAIARAVSDMARKALRERPRRRPESQ
jgi:integrase